MIPAPTASPPVPDRLLCGSDVTNGLLKSEYDIFERDLAALRENPKASKADLWVGTGNNVWQLHLPWRAYPIDSVSFVSFNGCSATVMQNFAIINYNVDSINLRSCYDKKGMPGLEKVNIEKFRNYVWYKLFSRANPTGPLFLNLPPAGEFYGSARKFLEANGAEIACEFVNPNYPYRALKKEYTTLYVFDKAKWMNCKISSPFKGLIK